ncbi:hypothetical protein LEMLEM_LOCUS8439 [Lemmus lemmus]
MELLSPGLWWRPRARNPGMVSQKGWLRVGGLIGRVSAMSCESRDFAVHGNHDYTHRPEVLQLLVWILLSSAARGSAAAWPKLQLFPLHFNDDPRTEQQWKR